MMTLKEYIDKQIRTNINERINEGRPIPMDTPNDFVYSDFKKYASKNKKMFKKELEKSKGDGGRMFLTLSALWYKWARVNHKEFTHIKDSYKFGRALMVMMVKDDLIFSIDAFNKTNDITKLKEDWDLDQAFNDAKPVEDESIEEETKRDYKKEYEKYGKSEKSKKYRAELNKYNRDKGTYGNGDGKDASHKGGKIVGFEDESKNRGRAEKSRLKKEATFSPNSGTMSGGVLQLDDKKYQLKKDIKGVKIGDYTNIVLPKGTILYNIAGGLFADHKSLEQYANRNRQYFKKPTFKGIQITQKTDTIKDIEKNSKVLESVNEEQIDEKLITFSSRAPYGQVVFMAGGAGSGKGFAKDNFIDAAGFKVRDVDEMKKALGKLDQLGKFSVDKWYKKYGKKLSDKSKNGGLSPKAHVEEFVLGKGLSIADVSKDLKNPNNVASLHYIVDAMGLKDKWVINMLSGKTNKETLPNLLFDITAKDVSGITDVTKRLMPAGYDSKNVHLVWVLADYVIAVERNSERDRVVPNDILLQTHEGAGKTMWEILTKALPKAMNGRIDVILNNNENTIFHKQKSQRKGEAVGVVSGFLSLPIKKQGGGIIPEKVWKDTLYKWIGKNAPKTINLQQDLDKDESVVTEAKDNLYLQLHKKYAKQIKGLKAKKIKKLTDLVSVQRWSMEEREDYFDKDRKKVKELSAEYKIERTLLKKYMGGDYSVMLPKGTEKLQEAKGNDTYFKTAGEAVGFAKTKAEKKGFEIDEDDWNTQITHGGRYSRLRPSVGKTHSFTVGLHKNGKPQRKGLSISLFGMDSGNYELTYYIN